MRGGAGVALVAVGIILLWMAITGKLDCLTGFVSCVFGTAPESIAATQQQQQQTTATQFLNNLPGIVNFANGLFGQNQPQTSSPLGAGQRL